MKTIILVVAGIVTIAAMIYCIMRDQPPQQKTKDTQSIEIVDDQSESNYNTVDDGDKGGDESVYESI